MNGGGGGPSSLWKSRSSFSSFFRRTCPSVRGLSVKTFWENAQHAPSNTHTHPRKHRLNRERFSSSIPAGCPRAVHNFVYLDNALSKKCFEKIRDLALMSRFMTPLNLRLYQPVQNDFKQTVKSGFSCAFRCTRHSTQRFLCPHTSTHTQTHLISTSQQNINLFVFVLFRIFIHWSTYLFI